MLKEEISVELRNEIEATIAPLSDTLGFYDLVKESLNKVIIPGNIELPWSFLSLIVCDAICGHWKHALPACAGLEMLRAAAEIFDDNEDNDSVESLSFKHGMPLANNAASTLLILAERAFTSLNERGVDSDAVLDIMKMINSYYTTICAGQHLDLSTNSQEAISEEIYLRLIEMKSASAVVCACHTGALLAHTNQKILQLFKIFGHSVGMTCQIANDIKGITSLKDIRKHKKTLPIIFALLQSENADRDILKTVFCTPGIEIVVTPDHVKDLLFKVGAIHYSTIKMELYKQQAINTLGEIEQAGVNVEQLKYYLS